MILDTISNLKTTAGTSTDKLATVLGYTAVGDGGGGNFIWDAASTLGENAGTVFQVAGIAMGRWLRQYDGAINVKWFGAKGDYNADTDVGVDDTVALRAAFAYCSISGSKLISDGNKKYRITSTITIDIKNKNAFVIDFNGSYIYIFNAYLSFLYNDNKNHKTTSLQTDIFRGATHVVLTSIEGIEVGDLMHISSPAKVGFEQSLNHYYTINDIDTATNKVYVDKYIVNDITAQQIIDDGVTGAIVVNIKKMSRNFTIRNMHIISDKQNEQTLQILDQDFLLVENCSIYNASRFGLSIRYCGRSRVSKFVTSRSGYTLYDQPYTHKPTDPDAKSFGYGIIHRDTSDAVVENSQGSYEWHSYDASNGTTFISYHSCKTTKDTYGFSTHGGVWEANYFNCEVVGGFGMTHRCVFLYMKNCLLQPTLDHGHGFGGFGYSETILDSTTIDMVSIRVNSYPAYATNSSGTSPRDNGAISQGRDQTFRMTNCSIINTFRYFAVNSEVCVFRSNNFIAISGRGTGIQAFAKKILTVDNNYVEGAQGQTPFDIQMYDSQRLTLSNNIISGIIENEASSALVYLRGNGTPEALFIVGNDTTSAIETYQYIFRVMNNPTMQITRIANNTRFYALGSAPDTVTVQDALNNLLNRSSDPIGGWSQITRVNKNYSISANLVGNSNNRPDPKTVYPGFSYIDTTLNRIIARNEANNNWIALRDVDKITDISGAAIIVDESYFGTNGTAVIYTGVTTGNMSIILPAVSDYSGYTVFVYKKSMSEDIIQVRDPEDANTLAFVRDNSYAVFKCDGIMWRRFYDSIDYIILENQTINLSAPISAEYTMTLGGAFVFTNPTNGVKSEISILNGNQDGSLDISFTGGLIAENSILTIPAQRKLHVSISVHFGIPEVSAFLLQ